ncbi:MAG: hypothetical protein OEY34_09760, partial [Cyclobacteriaceae bacterium]|nr:hypothetical protein [Cyclobacteriaceae bacterium]
ESFNKNKALENRIAEKDVLPLIPLYGDSAIPLTSIIPPWPELEKQKVDKINEKIKNRINNLSASFLPKILSKDLILLLLIISGLMVLLPEISLALNLFPSSFNSIKSFLTPFMHIMHLFPFRLLFYLLFFFSIGMMLIPWILIKKIKYTWLHNLQKYGIKIH